MKKLNYVAYISLAFATNGYSQCLPSEQCLNLNYNGNNVELPLALTSALSIDSNTGDVNATVALTAEEIGTQLGLQPVGNSPEINFNVTLNNEASAATISTTVSEDAVYCQKSGVWGSAIFTANPPLSYVTSLANDVVSSNSSNYSLTCANSFGKTTRNTTVSGIVTILNPEVTINVTPTTVASGSSATVTWSVTNSPDSCDFSGSGQWPAGIDENGPFQFDVTNITTPQTFSVLCDNAAAGNSGTQSATVSVQGQTAWPSCSSPQTAILNGNEDRTILAQFPPGTPAGSYNGLFEELQGNNQIYPFPGQFGDVLHLSLERNKYIAAKFTVSNTGYDAKALFQIPSSLEGPGALGRTITISECPGDFNHHLNQSRCKTNGEALFWSTKANPAGPPGYFCELEQGRTYYLNVVHSNNLQNNNYATTTCGHSFCGILAVMNPVEF